MSVEHESADSMEIPSPGEADDVSADEESVRPSGPSATRRLIRRCRARWRPILAAAFATATIAVPVGVYFLQYRPAQRLDDTATHQEVQAASDGAAAVVSYSYDNLDRDIARAKSLSTGEFLAYYSKFSQDFVAPAATKGHLIATAKVLRAAAIELHPDSAVVLVFMNQNTSSKEKPQPLTTASSVVVTLTKVNGSWLIAKLDPL